MASSSATICHGLCQETKGVCREPVLAGSKYCQTCVDNPLYKPYNVSRQSVNEAEFQQYCQTEALPVAWIYESSYGYMAKLSPILRWLESLSRSALNKVEGGIELPPSLTIGQEVPETAFTNYDQLEAVLDKYDRLFSHTGLGIGVDKRKEIIALRDVLAHGRVQCSEMGGDKAPLIKFSRPTLAHNVRVENLDSGDTAWFKEKEALLMNAFNKVSYVHDRILTLHPDKVAFLEAKRAAKQQDVTNA